MRIRDLLASDWPAVGRIYAEGIATGLATFETATPEWVEWDARQLAAPRLVADDAGAVVGWVAATRVSDRACYAGVVEHGVYVRESRRGQGVGRLLLEAFLAEAPTHGIWTVQTAIIAENAASLALHRQCGFRVVGHRERIAKRGDRWHDTVLLEHRFPDP